jgi:glucose-1-phosphate thymidylyltransferase
MRGVVLDGETGSRLNLLTKVTNKHLLPAYDKPMVYYPIQTFVNAGIREIRLVTTGKNAQSRWLPTTSRTWRTKPISTAP